jgi:hypothetical protein
LSILLHLVARLIETLVVTTRSRNICGYDGLVTTGPVVPWSVAAERRGP